MDVAELAAQEDELVYERFDQAAAWQLGCLLVELGQQRRLRISIGIDLGAQEVFRCGLPGTSADNDSWMRRKFAVVRRYNHSSLLMARMTEALPERTAVLGLNPAEFAFSGGGFPLIAGGSLVGCVGVSGLADADDHALVVEGLRRHHSSSVPQT